MTPPTSLPEDVAALVRLSATIAVGRIEDLVAQLASAGDRVDPREIDEAILQAWLFVGFPATLEAMVAWSRIRDRASSDEDPLAGPEAAPQRAARGEALCRSVYGTAYEPLRRNVAAAHPSLDRWMVETGYGTVLGRAGLAPLVRELCIVAILAAQGWGRQLHSHLRGAVNHGAPRAWVEAALEEGLAVQSPPTATRLRALAGEIMDGLASADDESGGESTDVH